MVTENQVREVAVGLLTEQADPHCNPNLSGVGSLKPYRQPLLNKIRKARPI
jgi:hypothetical protein